MKVTEKVRSILKGRKTRQYIYRVELNGKKMWACSDGASLGKSKVVEFGDTMEEARSNYRKELWS